MVCQVQQVVLPWLAGLANDMVATCRHHHAWQRVGTYVHLLSAVVYAYITILLIFGCGHLFSIICGKGNCSVPPCTHCIMSCGFIQLFACSALSNEVDGTCGKVLCLQTLPRRTSRRQTIGRQIRLAGGGGGCRVWLGPGEPFAVRRLGSNKSLFSEENLKANFAQHLCRTQFVMQSEWHRCQRSHKKLAGVGVN